MGLAILDDHQVNTLEGDSGSSNAVWGGEAEAHLTRPVKEIRKQGNLDMHAAEHLRRRLAEVGSTAAWRDS